MDKAVPKPQRREGRTAAAPVHPSAAAIPIAADGGCLVSRGAEPHGREEAIGRRPSWPRKCQARGPGRYRLSGRDRILTEMLHQRGNRAVTNNSCSSELVPMQHTSAGSRM